MNLANIVVIVGVTAMVALIGWAAYDDLIRLRRDLRGRDLRRPRLARCRCHPHPCTRGR